MYENRVMDVKTLLWMWKTFISKCWTQTTSSPLMCWSGVMRLIWERRNSPELRSLRLFFLRGLVVSVLGLQFPGASVSSLVDIRPDLLHDLFKVVLERRRWKERLENPLCYILSWVYRWRLNRKDDIGNLYILFLAGFQILCEASATKQSVYLHSYQWW